MLGNSLDARAVFGSGSRVTDISLVPNMTEAQTDRALVLADRYVTILERRMELQTRELELEVERYARQVDRGRKRDAASADEADRIDQLIDLVEQLLRQQAGANNLGEQLLKQTTRRASTGSPKVDGNGNPV